jgi:hypothetical protein
MTLKLILLLWSTETSIETVGTASIALEIWSTLWLLNYGFIYINRVGLTMKLIDNWYHILRVA